MEGMHLNESLGLICDSRVEEMDGELVKVMISNLDA